MSAWVEHVIWWQVFPLGFVGADKELAGARPAPHQLSRLQGWLDHLVALGANGLALAPVFTSRTHGYDTTDHLRIDPRLGTEDDFWSRVRPGWSTSRRAPTRGARSRWTTCTL